MVSPEDFIKMSANLFSTKIGYFIQFLTELQSLSLMILSIFPPDFDKNASLYDNISFQQIFAKIERFNSLFSQKQARRF